MGSGQMSVWNVPFRRNPFFTGRELVFAQIHTHLHAGETTALSQPPAISGLGGIGKTQMAVEYAYRYRDSYQFVLWVQTNDHETLLTNFVALARLLNLPEKDAREQQMVVHALKQWFETHTDWLLIFDNADDLAMVRDYIPERTKGHTLLTTRAQAMSGLARKIELDTMEPEEGTELLLRRASIISKDTTLESASTTDRAAALDIVRVMGGLPLALDQAGAYIEETNESVSNYLTMYQQQRAELLRLRGGLVPDHPDSVATTWSLAFERVERVNPAAIELMRFCAFLAPDAIPEELIIEGAPNLGPILQPVVANRSRLNAAIAELLKYSLIRRDSSTHTLIIHRLVQAVIKDEMDEETQRHWAQRAVQATRQVFPFNESPPWLRSQLYLPHALVCEDLIKEWDLTLDEAATLLNIVGWYLKNRGQYREAEPLMRYALTVGENLYGRDHPNTDFLLNNLAVLYFGQGKYEEAEPLYQRVLTITEKVLGPEHRDTASTLNNLATLFRNQGKDDEAEPLFQRALAIKEKALGPEHPSTASTLNNLATLYANQGKYEEAEPLFQRALVIREKVLGPEHPDTAATLDNLAILYKDQGKDDKAEPLFQRALAIEEKVLGREHHSTADTLNNLALLYMNQGKDDEAQPLLQRALAIKEKALGREHRSTAATLNNLATLYTKQGKYNEAEPLYQRALAIYEKALGREHRDTKITQENYTNLLQMMGQKTEDVDQQN
jgi:tetratricopeptide (TPR) repeat protein